MSAVVGERLLLPAATLRRSFAVLGRSALDRPRLLVLALVSTLAASASSVVAPLLLGRIVDAVIGRQTGRVTGLVVGLVLAAVVAALLLALANRFCEQLGVTLAAGLREQVLDRALRLDAATLEAAGSGDVAARVTEDVELVNESARVASAVLIALVTVVVTAAGFASLDWRLAVAFCAVVPVYAVALRVFLPTASTRYGAERRAAAARTQTVLTVLRGSATVRAYGMEARQSAVVEAASHRAVQTGLHALRALLKFSNLMNAAEAVGLSALLVTGFFGVRAGWVSVGDVTAAALLFHRLFGPLGTLLMTFDEIQHAGAALARLVGVIDLAPAPVQPERPWATAGLRARGVTHHYAGGPDVLHAIDVEVPAGTSLAVVGESGAGKTTLAALLGGVFPATAGAIAVGDVPVAELDPEQLRRRVVVVTQEVHTFTGTLAEDLRLARPSATEGELRDALRVVGADGWVAALPSGLDTVVGGGGQALTADQAQQLALARVVLADPPAVILDEATAEAGSAGARVLERSARAAIAGRTAVVVAHRLTQARECDQIAVMAHGRIVELGPHDDLVAAGGTYARLWSAWSH